MRKDIQDAFDKWLENRFGKCLLSPMERVAALAFEAGSHFNALHERKTELIKAGWIYDPDTGEDLR